MGRTQTTRIKNSKAAGGASCGAGESPATLEEEMDRLFGVPPKNRRLTYEQVAKKYGAAFAYACAKLKAEVYELTGDP